VADRQKSDRPALAQCHRRIDLALEATVAFSSAATDCAIIGMLNNMS
jgi:hypothetical protein